MKWLDTKLFKPPSTIFIANIVDDTGFSYVTVGIIKDENFYDYLSEEIFYDIERGEQDQFEKIPISHLKFWMPFPDGQKSKV